MKQHGRIPGRRGCRAERARGDPAGDRVFAILAVAAAAPLAAENIDLVVMVDTSESMFPYFDDLMNYLVQDLLTTRLHRGDTFHLLSFSSAPEVEISLEVNSEEAAQRAFGRILLLHALGRYTDLVSALQFLSKYTKELPETNPKQIILITDGIHDPPPGSPNAAERGSGARGHRGGRPGHEEGRLDVRHPQGPARARARRRGHEELPAGHRRAPSASPSIPYSAGDKEHVTGRTTGFPSLTFPPNLGKVGSRFTAPFKVKNWKTEPIIVQPVQRAEQRPGAAGQEGPRHRPRRRRRPPFDVPLRLPMSFPRGDQSLQVQLVFDDDLRISPTAGTLSFTYTGKGGIPDPAAHPPLCPVHRARPRVIYLLVRLFLHAEEARAKPRRRDGASRGTRAERRARRARRRRGCRGRGGAGPAPRAAAAAARRPRAVAPPAAARPRTCAAASAPRLHAAPVLVVPKKRSRPTVTSIRRALPRQEMQQSNLPPLIEMRVTQQNHRVGFRNVHRLAPGSSHTVGGRFSAYLVFLVPFPPPSREIRNVDGTYVFTPLRAELFPGLSGPVEDCLGKEIPFVSPRGMELSLHFRQWVSPLEEINTLMRQARSMEMGK